MLKLRVLTAAVLVPLMVWATYYLSTPRFAVLIGLFILAASWEWTALCQMVSPLARAGYVAALAAVGVVAYHAPALPVMAAGVAWWIWALFELLYYPDIHKGYLASRSGRKLSGFFILVPAWLALVTVHADPAGGPTLTLFVMVLVWVADTGAYFVGRPFGKTKIAPHISPGKSLEGLLGGLTLVAIMALVCGKFVWKFKNSALMIWLIITVVAMLFSVLGDLVESRAKRIAGVKDSGTILPGHGGLLDRIDAFTAAAPTFVLAWLLLRPLL